jgi:hypothetical protein
LSTSAVDERTEFGEHSQVDIYRITTLNDLYTSQAFDQYGNYSIELTGFVEDVWGNRYEGGGTYNVLVAETLDLSPSVLPGTPFEAGNSVNLGVHISPGARADVTVHIRVYPTKGDQILEQTIEGHANSFGIFQPESPFLLEVPGEYVIDYEARYTDSEGRLWAGSLRSAGVIGRPGSHVVARGQRGMANANVDQAWFLVEQASETNSENAQLYNPYFSGDVAWLLDTRLSSIIPRLRLQDTAGGYTAWLRRTHPNFVDSSGTLLARLDALDNLPINILTDNAANDEQKLFNPNLITNNSYAYFNYVTPHNSVRQYILGSENGDIPLQVSLDDPLNRQIGAGVTGIRPEDFIFLFGGAVIENEDASLQETAIYGALAVATAVDDNRGARIFPPYRGASGGPDGGALFSIDGEAINTFFHPTGTRPGDVLEIGDNFNITGQVAPTLASDVIVQITSPSGQQRSFTGKANAIGYYYDPLQDFAVDETGLWTVSIIVSHTGRTSAGIIDEGVLPTGGVLGAVNNTYNVYVVQAGDEKLTRPTTINEDSRIPPGFPFNFNFDVPQGWTDIQPYLTVKLPGRIVQDEAIRLQGNTFAYQYNPTILNQQNPFFEGNDGRVTSEASSDPLTITFVFTGLNENNEPDILVRQAVIRHDRLITLD